MTAVMPPRIPVYQPDLTGKEREYVLNCIESTWISSAGDYIEQFEQAICNYVGIPHGVAVFNGTVALHLALECLGIGPGDEVLVPSFTYIASVNAIVTTGATPILVESRVDDWLMDIEDAARKITPRTKAIMPVHLYGFACDMPAVRSLADKHGLKVIEDAAEALGVFVDGDHLGAFSDASTFSFFGNKTITCGEGGIVMTSSQEIDDALRVTKNHGMSPVQRYWHDRLGFNYRMTNIQAAIGLAQSERLTEIVARKRALYDSYRAALAGAELTWQETAIKGLESSYWLISMLARDETTRNRIMQTLADNNIESRPVFNCAHKMPMLSPSYDGGPLPIAEDISARGFSIPSYPGLTQNDVTRISELIRKAATI